MILSLHLGQQRLGRAHQADAEVPEEAWVAGLRCQRLPDSSDHRDTRVLGEDLRVVWNALCLLRLGASCNEASNCAGRQGL